MGLVGLCAHSPAVLLPCCSVQAPQHGQLHGLVQGKQAGARTRPQTSGVIVANTLAALPLAAARKRSIQQKAQSLGPQPHRHPDESASTYYSSPATSSHTLKDPSSPPVARSVTPLGSPPPLPTGFRSTNAMEFTPLSFSAKSACRVLFTHRRAAVRRRDRKRRASMHACACNANPDDLTLRVHGSRRG